VGTSSLLRADQGSLNISNLARLCETVRDMHRKGESQYSCMSQQPETLKLCPQQSVADLSPWHRSSRVCRTLHSQGLSMNAAQLHPMHVLRCRLTGGASLTGHRVVIVSSGAIGVGCLRLGLKERPSAIAQKQALAAVGQVHLMRYYEDLFSAVGLVGTHLRQRTDTSAMQLDRQIQAPVRIRPPERSLTPV